MKKILYIGGTGTGKTFRAIKESDNFVIAVPCRQLAYDIFVDYEEVTGVLTGEASHHDGNNYVAVYENLNPNSLSRFSTLIIDEAHFLTDEDRGAHLVALIEEAIRLNMDIILLTATDNIQKDFLREHGFKTIELKPFAHVEKIELQTEDQFEDLIRNNNNLKLLFFNARSPQRDASMRWKINYIKDLYGRDIKIAFMDATVPVVDRVQIQNDFKQGKIDVIFSTNVLAQGVNLPADVVYVEYNMWDSDEIILQKIGRAGRPGYAEKGYYFISEKEKPSKLYKKPVQKEGRYDLADTYYIDIITPDDENNRTIEINIDGLDYQWFQIPEIVIFTNDNNEIEKFEAYDLTYARGFLRTIVNSGLDCGIANDVHKKILNEIENNAEKTIDKLLKMKGERK